MFFPKKIKYKKQFTQKIKKQTSSKSSQIIYGSFALKALTSGRISSRQIEATRRIIIKKMKKLGFLWIRIFPDNPVTAKPIETRMGKGKGAFSYWSTNIKSGQILYEISGISYINAIKALKSGANKLPILTKVISKEFIK